MQYSFTCPLEGCKEVLTVDAKNNDEAVDMLSQRAKEHLMQKHPDVKKTDEEISSDIISQMTQVVL
jgi:hypothetical protein